MMRPPEASLVSRGISTDPSYNPASAVVIVRDGRRTVLTIEAAYVGPPTELSLVVPVPSAIGRDAVRTVTGTAFRRLDQRTAPRVRHVFPPCPVPRRAALASAEGAGGSMDSAGRSAGAAPPQDEFGVEIEDEWPLDEYDVTLLSAEESTGLLAFLRERGLDLPRGATPMLRGYIETGHRFVLFRADPSRAQRVGETMVLSPLQLEYDSEQLVVPVRLGTLNSPGEQELLLYVISTEGRFEVANRPGVVAPTNLRMRRDARGAFAELYTSITDEIFRRTPGAAITEYAHPVGTHVRRSEVAPFVGPIADSTGRPLREGGAADTRAWTVTRIRHRYGTELDDDLTLRAAEPLTMTNPLRRWRQLNVRPRRGMSAFHVQYVVEHTRCTDPWTASRIARRYATAESMWSSRHDLWPGEVLVDRIDLLGIEPGSTAPAGWPPPPPPPRPIQSEVPAPEAPAPAPLAAPRPPPPAPVAAPPAAASTGWCSVRGGRGTSGWLLLVVAAVALSARRR
jgi:hypothetical protein